MASYYWRFYVSTSTIYFINTLYTVSKTYEHSILKSLFLAFARCEIISLRVLPISTPVTHEIKKGNKKDEKRRERERDTKDVYRYSWPMQMQDRLFCARTRGWRFYERLTLLRSQPVQRTIRSRSNDASFDGIRQTATYLRYARSFTREP